jgi:hypothetical protein
VPVIDVGMIGGGWKMRATGGPRLWTCFVMGVLVAGRVCASPIQITVDTSSLSGLGILAFDFIDGGPPFNSVTISGFASDGAPGDACVTHDFVTCDPAPKLTDGAVTLDDTVFSFTEYRQSITFGNSFSFLFDTTGNPAEPGSQPDGFSLFLLDQDAIFSLVETADPTGALFVYAIGATEPLQIFTELVQLPSAAPEPGALALCLAGLIGVALVRAAANNNNSAQKSLPA